MNALTNVDSIHAFSVESIEGGNISFAGFRGKKILVVNVASECGYTPQYAQLQELYTAFQDKLVVVGFPCNDFGGQEPGGNAAIQQFCSARYGVTFPMAAKIQILGPGQHPVYQWLTRKAANGVSDSEVSWNFHKYLLDEDGRLLQAFPPSASPFDDALLNYLAE